MDNKDNQVTCDYAYYKACALARISNNYHKKVLSGYNEIRDTDFNTNR